MANAHIRGDMVEVSEFPHLAVKYNVQGVPKTVINETHDFLGVQPETKVLRAIQNALGI
jgi:predicted DsbA family dithiol-disulfide isomerase